MLKAGVFLNSVFAGAWRCRDPGGRVGHDGGHDDRPDPPEPHQVRLLSRLQQEITDDIGVFGRWSWNNSQNEIMAFTDIESTSLSLGASIKVRHGGRPDDRIGIGGALNMLSSAHIGFLAAGFGPLVGDGQLPHYRPEKVIETYYAFQLFKGLIATADYQLLIDPAYNADRGPVHVFSGRLHAGAAF